MPLDRQDALKHLKTIEGHIRGVARMVEENAYCIDVLHQTLAIQRAIDKLNQNLLEHHMQTCVSRALHGQDSDDRERVIRELFGVFAVSARRPKNRTAFRLDGAKGGVGTRRLAGKK